MLLIKLQLTAFKKICSLGAMAHAYNPGTREVQAEELQEFGANLGYTVSSSTAGYGVRPYLKTKQQHQPK